MPTPADDTLADLNYQEFSRLLARAGGADARIAERDGALFCASSSTFPVIFNTAWRTDPGLDAHRFVARANDWFGSLGRSWSMAVRNLAVDDDLRAAAADAGMIAALDSPEMTIARAPDDRVPPDGVSLRWVESVADLDDFCAVGDAAYGPRGLPAGTPAAALRSVTALAAPHVHSVVASEAGRPVAAAQCVLSHSIAGVFWVGTDPAAARRGLGDLVTRAVVRRGFACGARFVSLQASEMGEPVYRRMGFVERYRYATWIAPRAG